MQQPRLAVAYVNSSEFKALAARKYSRGDFMHLGSRENEHNVCGRLLNKLQQRVECCGREHVHLIYDIDLVLAGHRRVEGFFLQITDIADTVVGSGIYLGDIGVILVDTLAYITFKTGIPVLQVGTVESFCEYLRAGSLSRSTRARKEISVGGLPVFELIFQRCGDMLLRNDIIESTRAVFSVKCEICHTYPFLSKFS